MRTETETESSPRSSPLDALYAAHWVGLVRLAWLLVHDDGLAEDIVQDAFISTHRHWSRIEDPTRAAAYLRRSVVNGCRSALRHRGVQERYAASLASQLDHQTWPSAEMGALRRRGDEEIIAALARLSERQREVIVLRYYLDLDEQAIATALGLGRNAVKSHSRRGLAALRASLTTGAPS